MSTDPALPRSPGPWRTPTTSGVPGCGPVQLVLKLFLEPQVIRDSRPLIWSGLPSGATSKSRLPVSWSPQPSPGRLTLPTLEPATAFYLLLQGDPPLGYGPAVRLGWPLPSSRGSGFLGNTRQEGHRKFSLLLGPPVPVPITSQGPVNAHLMAGRTFCARRLRCKSTHRKPQKLRGQEGLGPLQKALCRGLGGCGSSAARAGAPRSRSWATSWPGGGGWGRAGQGSGPLAVGEGWGPAVPGAGSGLHCRALHLPHTCNAWQCCGHSSQGPTPPTCGGIQGGPATCSPHPSSQSNCTEARGAATLPWTQAFARGQERLVTRPVLLADPAVFCSPGGPSRSGKARPLRRAQAPGPSPYLVNGAVSWCGGQAVLQVPMTSHTSHQAGWARLQQYFPAA